LNRLLHRRVTIGEEWLRREARISGLFSSPCWDRRDFSNRSDVMIRSILVLAGLSLAVAGMVSRFADKVTPASAPVVARAVETPAPAAAAAHGRMVTIARDARGHFQVEGRVDGRRLSFMVDTGASVIALTASDAARLGIRPTPRQFTVTVRTANGSVKAAPVELGRVEVDGIVVRDVRALVAPDNALTENLLGLSFLTKLRRWEYANGKLVLEQ
jgi:aspartyl protease family protein